MDTLNKSLKDLQIQRESQEWASKHATSIALDGKNVQFGTGVAERDGKIYIAQTVEVLDKKGDVIRQITDCVRGDKKWKILFTLLSDSIKLLNLLLYNKAKWNKLPIIKNNKK